MQETKFERAMREVMAKELEAMAPQTEKHEFSEEFEAKMNNLIHRRRRTLRRIIFTAGKIAACMAVVTSAFLFLPHNKTEAEDIDINNFDINTCKEYSIITLKETDPDAPLSIKDRYQLTYDLSGYELITITRDSRKYGKYYQKGEVQIYYDQFIKKGLYTHWNTEASVIQEIEYRGTDAIYFYNPYVNGHYLIWEDDDYIFSVIVGEGDREMLFELADSLQKEE